MEADFLQTQTKQKGTGHKKEEEAKGRKSFAIKRRSSYDLLLKSGAIIVAQDFWR